MMRPARVLRSGGGLAAALAVLLVAALNLPACGGEGSAASPSQTGETLALKLETAHFRLLADRASATVLRDIADNLETALPRMSADLGVTALPTTTVEVWTDAEWYYADMVATLGRRYDGSTGYVAGPTNVTILVAASPALTASHEFAHCVSLRLNPSFGNNPRWLWESVALYENGEFVNPRTLTYLVSGSYPTLVELNGDFGSTKKVYEVGYLIGEFIVATWGKDGLIRLIAANGDLSGALGLGASEFEQRWAAFVTQRYLQG